MVVDSKKKKSLNLDIHSTIHEGKRADRLVNREIRA